MSDNLLTDEQIERIYSRVIADSTRWNLMTGKELENRLAAFRDDKQNYDKCLELISSPSI